jgi:glyoxylate/hydroxypyruvate reductase A
MGAERLVFYSASADPPEEWRQAFGQAAPEVEFLLSDGTVDRPETIDWAVVWRPPSGLLASLSNLRCVFSLGAGVDHLLSDPDFPRGVPLSRVVDRYLTARMTEYVVLHTLAHHRELFRSLVNQTRSRWVPFASPRADETRVGIMGLGELGLDAARKLLPLGYRIAGWSASRKSEPGVESFAGDAELAAFLARTDILICLLPLTAATRGILNAAAFAQLPRGARIVNAARGLHLVEADLIAALDSGHLAGATLDVFPTEPLPEANPLWHHKRVVVTPHIASFADPRSMATTMATSMARIRRGEPPLYQVDLDKGY